MKKNITAYSGKDKEEDVVYSSHNLGNVCIAKNYTKPKQTYQHTLFMENAGCIKALWDAASTAYKEDLSHYAHTLNINFPDKLKITSYALFVKICYAVSKATTISLRAFNLGTFATAHADTIAATMARGFIYYMKSCENLTHPIV